MTKLLTNNRLFKYLRESKQELEKVSWPTQEQTTRYAIIVIIFCLALAVYFGLLDWVLNLGLEQLIKLTVQNSI
ncbi:preprotein translocase subunit SecE [Candidatus Uhrbacteria bacterium RIFOXYB2_FULL_41_10]|nr:MAG: preprotein translocase subunit SecE [Candidatus Uhrbacteria bacterium RIFOXYA2_FULL_41_8]OGL94973.1 MAG: preprotein translocase subunit SecE [Candidatus Uhrbacteria bacterium RIFOXYB2_FULL_41_10]